MRDKTLLISGGMIFRRNKGEKPEWFIIKQNGSEYWEAPKSTARRGESSVRAILRASGEQGGMRSKVLEEAGRSNSSATVAGRSVSSKYIYYLMVCKDQGEVLGYEEYDWVPFASLSKRLGLKRELTIFKNAKKILAEKDREKKKARKAALQAKALSQG